jgi:hypothetical protein
MQPAAGAAGCMVQNSQLTLHDKTKRTIMPTSPPLPQSVVGLEPLEGSALAARLLSIHHSTVCAFCQYKFVN